MNQSEIMKSNQTDTWANIWTEFVSSRPCEEYINNDDDESLDLYFQKVKVNFLLKNFFFERLRGAEFHWFFVQSFDALLNNLYLPAVLSFLNGIEASLRITIAQINEKESGSFCLNPNIVLSNRLIFTAQQKGLPIIYLAFPNENNFEVKPNSTNPNKINVEIVRLRNNICHGNILEFINSDLGSDNMLFTPDLLRNLAFDILNISGVWAEHLGEYRKCAKFLYYTNLL